MARIRAIGMVSNGISAAMLHVVLESDGHALSEVALILQRNVTPDWATFCAEVIKFDMAPSLHLLGQVKTVGYYRQATSKLKAWLASGTVQDVYIANIDNVLSNHVLQTTRSNGGPRLSVIAEGNMNYQDIGPEDRAAWRWRVKPLAARALGLSYVQPKTHLAGAFEPEVSRIFAYSPNGLKAPPHKIIEVPFPQVTPRFAPEPNTALIILTGVSMFMTPELFARFKVGFGNWIRAQNFRRILVKRHPFYPSGNMEEALPRHEIVTDKRSLEQIAPDIAASTIIGYCTTGLVTLKLMRPDLRCIDWGSDFYCMHAYHGDFSVVSALRSAGVEIIEFEAPLTNPKVGTS